ncbi:ABC transporter ATP-binding protein [Dietzia kunjamensis]|uniref:ABC transporter ATP-binding protein n=1 Tax=Dietzia kunjamensis TaxID=322509 RepID=UPI0022B3FE27|nr:ABC transporter ATP-binding protein [Dietzia kunjamensis]MCZ4656067.1 ABC transporter ATP-binding protein [Dietzia kunjamensis]MDJ0422688.1 ABC transporter ATP-binding protein [Dietzia kunjamensis]
MDGVDISLRRGETIGIVGESGSGKSMLVRSIMGIAPSSARVDPSSTVRFDGRDVLSLTRRDAQKFWGREIAMVFQDPLTSLNPIRTIGRQIIDPLRHHLGLSRKDAVDRAVEMLTRVRIPSPRTRLNEYPHQLSGGMRQRVGIAIALSCEPKLLIADEPTTALDVTVQHEILDLLHGLQTDSDMAMILVSHDLAVVSQHTDRIGVMYAGRFLEVGDTRALLDEPAHPYTGALLDSIPRPDQPPHTVLTVIEGRPPNLREMPVGCRFAPRCPRVADDCLAVDPPLEDLAGTPGLTAEFSVHRVGCLHPTVPAPMRTASEAS